MSVKISGSFDVTLLPDGGVRFDARKLCGSDSDLTDELSELAEMLTGEPDSLVVEKHVHKHGVSQHSHTHQKA